MLTSLLQQPPVKQRIGPMEPVDVQLPVFATNTRRPFSCRTTTHYSGSTPQNTSPRHKKRSITRRSTSNTSNPSVSSLETTPIQGPSPAGSTPARQEKPAASSPRANTSPRNKGQAKGATGQAAERKRKQSNSNLPPRLRAERRQGNKSREVNPPSYQCHHLEKEPEKSGKVQVMPPTALVALDTTQGQSKNLQDPVHVDECTETVHASESSEQCADQEESCVTTTESRLTFDLALPPSAEVQRSRRSSIAGSDVDEDFFQDALSDLPDRPKSGFSSTSSSAFVTPASTRCQSPIHHDRNSLKNSCPLDLVDSLEQLQREQELNTINKSAVVSPEDSPSCGSHVTLTEDHMTPDSPCPYTFIHNSQIHEGGSNHQQPSIPRPQSSNTVFQMQVGDFEVEVNGQECENFTFELPLSPGELNDDEQDSGCGMSIGSPSKSSLKKSKRPGLIYVPKEVIAKSRQIPRGSFELSSLSTASPQSSICTPSSSSPLSLSPSPTPPLLSRNSGSDKSFQEWPDIGSHQPVPMSQPALPNGVVHPAHTGEGEHHPTVEDMQRMEQWRNNLLAQLRQQQEKLDQKRKKECTHFPIPPTHALPPHGSLPPLLSHGPLPPLPPHRSLPPHGPLPPPPPHGYLPPLPYHSLPPHSTPMFMPPPPHAPHVPPPTVHMCKRPPHPHTLTQSTENERNTPPPTSWPSIEADPPPRPKATPPKPAKRDHPLCDQWVLWFDRIIGSHRNSYSDYKASLKKINTITSIESFWKLFNNIKPPSVLDNSTNYHFFKQGINPLWEDPANQAGGKWVLTIKENAQVLDKTWMEVLLMLIGGCAGKKSLVNGVVVSRRKKGNRIAVWTSEKETKSNLEICKELVEALVTACGVLTDQIPTFLKHLSECKNGLGLVFMHHTDSLRSGSSYLNESHIRLRDHIQELLHDLGCR